MRDLNRIYRRLREGQLYIHSLGSSSFGNNSFFFTKNALPPTFIVMAYADPSLWNRIRKGSSFEEILDFAADNTQFMDYLDHCLNETRMTNEEDKQGDEARQKYIRRICALLFTENT